MSKEQIRAREKAYRQRPEVKKRIRARKQKYHKEYYKRPEVIARRKKYNKEYRQRPEVKKYYDKRDKTSHRIKWARQYEKKKRERDKQFIIAQRLRNRTRRAINFYTKNGKIYNSKTYGVDYNKIINHLKPFPRDIDRFHIDHVKPLCSFDLENPEELKKALSPENHQWLEAKRNLRKGKKIISQSRLF